MLRPTRLGLELATMLTLALALLAGCAGAGANKAGGQRPRKPVVLTLANFFPDAQEVGGFAATVARLSHGSLRIDVESGWRNGQVAFENGLIRDVRAGKADLGIVGSRAWDSQGVRSFRVLGTPMLINSYALEDAALRSHMPSRMLKGLGALGLTGLGVLPGPLRYPVGISRALLAPSDYAGRTIGVQQSLVASATFRALAAKPVWFAVQAPMRGFAGFEQAIENVQGDRRRVIVTANVPLWPRPLVVFANDRAFARLSSAQQRILRMAAAADLRAETSVVVAQERQSAADLCRGRLVRFVDATPAELAALRRAVEPVYRELDADPENRQQIAQIEALRNAFAPQPPLSCGQSASAPVRTGLLDGAYRFTMTYGMLQAAGAHPGELNPSNVGTFTFVFDRGRFAETTESPQACVWDYGTVKVSGTRVSLLYSNGGGTPSNDANSPGEQFTIEWSLYRDSLTVRRVPGAISPTPFVAAPWLRISTTPSRGYLSRRCPPPLNALPR